MRLPTKPVPPALPAAVTVDVVQLPHAAGLPFPDYATPGAAGVDLRAALEHASPLTILPGRRALIPTGLTVAIPPGWEWQIRPRSGLALTDGITIPNAPGTIDSDYRGEVKVILANLGAEPFSVTWGMRIAQAVLCPVGRIAWNPSTVLPSTDRGAGGFGSTGTYRGPGGFGSTST